MGYKRDAERSHAASILRAMGYTVTEIEERSSPTCDLRVVLPSESMLVEVKTSRPSDEERGKLAREEPVTMTKSVGRSATMHGVLRHAAHQIDATASTEAAGLRLVWLRIVGAGELTRSAVWFSTLYGIRWFRIMTSEVPLPANIVPCFLADRAWFASHPEVCGVITEVGGRCGFRINPFSPAVEELRSTRLFQVLFAVGAVFGFNASKCSREFFVADPASVVAGEQAVIRSLYERYRITVQPTTEKAYSTAWPGHETGGLPGIPGHDCLIGTWDLLLRLRTPQ